MGGTIGSQVLSIVAAPLLTRLYTPDDFGIVVVYTSILAIIGIVASLRYELAIPLPESDQAAENIVALSLLVALGVAMLSGIVVLFFGEYLARLLGVPILESYLWLLPIGVLFRGVITTFNYWTIRTKQFLILAGTKLHQSASTLVVQLLSYKAGGLALLLEAQPFKCFLSKECCAYPVPKSCSKKQG